MDRAMSSIGLLPYLSLCGSQKRVPAAKKTNNRIKTTIRSKIPDFANFFDGDLYELKIQKKLEVH